MSGGGKIIEKRPMVLTDEDDPSFRKDVVRYLVGDYRHGRFDETYVNAEPADDEPQPGDEIWWGAEREIYWGPNDSKRLMKVGYSWSGGPHAR